MNLETVAESKLVASLGWTLVHSVWQIGLVSIVLLLVLRTLRNQTPNLRYVVSASALVISIALPVYTFIQFSIQVEVNRSSIQSPSYRENQDRKEFLEVNGTVSLQRKEPAPDRYGTAGAEILSDLQRWLNREFPFVLPFTVGFWVLGVGFFSLRLGGGFSQLSRFKNDSATTVNKHWQHVFSRLSDRTGVTRTVRFLRSEFVQIPIAIGFFKPVIVVPASLFLQMNPHELETIIAHELIHIRRYDPVVNIAQCIVEALFFYHPSVWWMSTQIRREREFAADAAVMDIFEDSHVMYARALANLEEIRLRADQQLPRYATAANGGNFMQRIQRILKIKTEAGRVNSAWTAGLALLLTSAFLLTVFSISSSEFVNAQQQTGGRKLAIGFVSIPPLDRTENPPKDSDATERLLIRALKQHKVPATGFLQGGMISDGEKLFPVRANIARMWIDAGFEIGLGGFKHVSLYNTPVDVYIANIEKNERIAKKLIGDTGRPPRYFSYPYLNTGKTAADKAQVESWLASQGYTSVKYTFDNNEWMYSFAYDTARNDNDVNAMKEIREAYLTYMKKMLGHYEGYSSDLFGRDIPQTMVLTPSRLVTDTADEFFAIVAERGYTFIPLDEAQSDTAYETKEAFTGEAGISWFERWSMAKGKPLREEPEIDQSVQKIWNERPLALKK